MIDDIDATIDKLHAEGATDDEITEIIREKFGKSSTPEQHGPTQPGTNSALTLAGTAAAVPVAANAAMRFGTSPTLPKTVGALARGATTAGGIIHGIYRGNPTEVISAPISGWAAGKGGYWLGQNMQSVARPIAGALEAAAPYAKMLGRAAGPQSALDLAQMAEPNRRDIGFLGIGPSVDVPGAEPPVLNAAYDRAKAALGRLYGRFRR